VVWKKRAIHNVTQCSEQLSLLFPFYRNIQACLGSVKDFTSMYCPAVFTDYTVHILRHSSIIFVSKYFSLLFRGLLNAQKIRTVGFQVLRAVTMKNSIFWDVTPCIPVKVYRRFGGTYYLYPQGRRVSQASDHEETSSTALPTIPLTHETSVNFYHTTRSHIPEDNTLNFRIDLLFYDYYFNSACCEIIPLYLKCNFRLGEICCI
jgi:hypothetical protein